MPSQTPPWPLSSAEDGVCFETALRMTPCPTLGNTTPQPIHLWSGRRDSQAGDIWLASRAVLSQGGKGNSVSRTEVYWGTRVIVPP